MYASVPKDIVKIKEKLIFSLTKRQLIFVIIAGILLYSIFSRLKNILGIEIAMYIAFSIIIPMLIIGFYEDDGVYFEEKIKNITYFYKNNKPKVYKSENFYKKGLLNNKIELVGKEK